MTQSSSRDGAARSAITVLRRRAADLAQRLGAAWRDEACPESIETRHDLGEFGPHDSKGSGDIAYRDIVMRRELGFLQDSASPHRNRQLVVAVENRDPRPIRDDHIVPVFPSTQVVSQRVVLRGVLDA